ncbi:MAG: hypothetical protein J5722_10200, partial [Oscillospiraceae bacterium]|nr:hypothetical protein [Oscillospiraceae bacterium]
MKMMRKMALMSAACLMLTALPLPAAAADDPVLTQVAAVQNEKFTVDAKKLGYTALNGECPERPEWYHMPEYEKDNYASDDEWWENNFNRTMSELNDYYERGQLEFEYNIGNSAGYGIIKDGKVTGPPLGYNKIVVVDKEGSIVFSTVMTDFNQDDYYMQNSVFSAASDYLYWYSEYGLRG